MLKERMKRRKAFNSTLKKKIQKQINLDANKLIFHMRKIKKENWVLNRLYK